MTIYYQNVNAESPARTSDMAIRVVEGLTLAALSVPYLMIMSFVAHRWLTTDEMLKFEIGQWAGMGGVWGLVSLWWLVLRVKPETAARIPRLPWGIAIGIVLGVVYLAQLVLGELIRRPFDPAVHAVLFFFCAVPLLILFDRLRVLRRYRKGPSP